MSESENLVAANSESIISSSSTEYGVRCDCNLTAKPVRTWTRNNPGRRFLTCRGRRVGRDYVKCDFFQWFELEPPHGWQHLALLEARDIINKQKEEIAKLRNQVNKQAHQKSNVHISNDLVEQLNDKSEECEALKRAVLVLTERSSVLRNVLVYDQVVDMARESDADKKIILPNLIYQTLILQREITALPGDEPLIGRPPWINGAKADSCGGQNRSRWNQCLKVRKNRHEHFYEKQIFEKYLFLRRILRRKHIHEKSEKSPKKVARSSARPARSLRSDRAQAKLGRYVATELEPS
ncbi:hypothetical protein F2Q69_00006367 [Brassica cretica]|uniref:GRF-type domain-containing protein n=1 Tax=Brassica cretica TaxID=69181 RepID=A0A8S9P947_BRACR|nr:hypothetical protein F2Q69_00006367 [Brassica cretica]